eukprot:1195104-Prorocentrum_minimum.AAC.3
MITFNHFAWDIFSRKCVYLQGGATARSHLEILPSGMCSRSIPSRDLIRPRLDRFAGSRAAAGGGAPFAGASGAAEPRRRGVHHDRGHRDSAPGGSGFSEGSTLRP